MQNTVQVKDRQTPLDVAIQTCGSVESVFDLAAKNGLSITSDLSPGDQLLTIPVVVSENVDYYIVHELFPASNDAAFSKTRGIEYDYIESPEPSGIAYPTI